jgi:hypothetical protein
MIAATVVPGAPSARAKRSALGILDAVKLPRRRTAEEPAPEVADDDAEIVGKGRPTPKRRESLGPRGPVTAPKTRKEAYARQKQLAKSQRAARKAPVGQLTVAQRRELMRSGDPSVLPRRDQGPTRKLARDYVDSHRMLSTYLLILFPIIVVGWFFPVLQLAVLVVFIGLLVEWYLVGRRIRRMALGRNGSAEGSDITIGFYAGSRAYIPRRWRMPAPQVGLGDDI